MAKKTKVKKARPRPALNIAEARPTLDLAEAFDLDARLLVQSRAKAQVSRRAKNIRSAGDEVEITFRDLLVQRLPRTYYVGHGHIVDSKLALSPQVDAVVADAQRAPALLRNRDGSEHFPFESIYAVGEVKSSYETSKKPVHVFCDTLDCLKSDLEREPVSIRSRRAFRPAFDNPLFSFMVFVDSGAYDWKKIKGLYEERPVDRLPSVLCFMDRGLVTFSRFTETGEAHLDATPGHQPNFHTSAGWTFRSLAGSSRPLGARLAMLFGLLMRHLSECVVEPPDLGRYLASTGLLQASHELLIPVKLD